MSKTFTAAFMTVCLAGFLTAQWRPSAKRAAVQETGAKNPEIVRISTIAASGGRLDWSGALNLIAFDKLDDRSSYFKLWVMRPDGSDQHCLTCDNPEFPRHSGNPAWHPSGHFIVFQAQNDFRLLGKITDYFANPGSGVNNNLFVTTYPAGKTWQLTHLPPREGGVLHAHFSHDGNYLLWSERFSSKGGKFGLWQMKIARFVEKGGIPSIVEERALTPGKQRQFYESHGFSPDDRKIFFSGNLTPNQDVTDDDVYSYDLTTNELRDLTNTPDEWDEHAQVSPSGRKIIWMTNRDLQRVRTPSGVKSDYWIMNPDGSDPQRLTYFNTPGTPEYINGGITSADSSWGPDGRHLAAELIEDPRRETSRIVMIEFRDAQ
jgi:Tol biopolymer transport system component